MCRASFQVHSLQRAIDTCVSIDNLAVGFISNETVSIRSDGDTYTRYGHALVLDEIVQVSFPIQPVLL